MPSWGHRSWPKLWVVLIAVDTAVEVWALRNSKREATLSHAIRTTYRTETRPGQYAFAASWVALTGWLLPHILNPKD